MAPNLAFKDSSAIITCPTVFCGPQALNIKKSLTGLSVQLGSHIFNARVHVSKASDVRAIIDLYGHATYLIHTKRIDRQL
jgi:hypothetical protein